MTSFSLTEISWFLWSNDQIAHYGANKNESRYISFKGVSIYHSSKVIENLLVVSMNSYCYEGTSKSYATHARRDCDAFEIETHRECYNKACLDVKKWQRLSQDAWCLAESVDVTDCADWLQETRKVTELDWRENMRKHRHFNSICVCWKFEHPTRRQTLLPDVIISAQKMRTPAYFEQDQASE